MFSYQVSKFSFDIQFSFSHFMKFDGWNCRVATILESPGISLIFAESPGKVLEFYTAPSMSFSNSRTFQDCGKCYIIFYIAVVYFSILICHFVLVTPCYITCWKDSVFLFFAYSGVSKSPGKSWNF